MKTYQDIPTYPIIRRSFKSYKDLGLIINRSSSYINNCLNGRKDFTRHEKYMILKYLGVSDTDENLNLYFPEVIKV